MPQITIHLDVTEAEARLLRANSLERVLNTSIRAMEAAGNRSIPGTDLTAIDHEEDLTRLKPLAARLWYAASNAAFSAAQPDTPEGS